MSQRRLTPSLINSILWYDSQDEGSLRQLNAYTQLENMVKRAPFVDSKYMAIGRAFEDKVTLTVNSGVESGHPIVDAFADFCQGGKFQVKVEKMLQGELVGGRIDVLFDDHIIDIKTSSRKRKPAHYWSTSQHYVYCYCAGVFDYTYAVARYDNDWPIPKVFDYDLFDEKFHDSDVRSELEKLVEMSLRRLKDLGLLQSFREIQ